MTISRPVFHYLMIGAMLAFSGAAMAQHEPNSSQTLQGAWNVTVIFNEQGLPPCVPAGTVFTAEGAVIAEPCFASLRTGYGAWTRTANNQFALTFIGNSFGPDGTLATAYKVRASVELGPTRDTFSGTFRTDLFDPAGALIGTFTGTVKAVRIAVEH